MVIRTAKSYFHPSQITSKIYFMFNGQISPKNEVGRWIYTLSSLEEVGSIVEIGTWNGRGSSKMIAQGVRAKLRLNPGLAELIRVTGFEVNYGMFKKSNAYLSKYPFFKVVYGSVIAREELDSFELSEEETGWFQQDFQSMAIAPLVEEFIPQSIDLLILDGGEFSTYAEFKKLAPLVKKWIILDDTFTRKCSRVLDEIRSNSKFEIVSESRERNGTAVIRVCN